MPYPNFHAARVRNPEDFEKIVVLQTLPNGIIIYGGPLKSDPQGASKTQAYRFPKDEFTESEAKQWLKDHDIKVILFEKATENMDLRYFKNQGDGIFEINIKGVVDQSGINGDDIAQEIKYLNNIGAKVIKERINSLGGGIINGFSIISANLNSEAEIHTYNDGMAGSIASVILCTGTPGKRFGFDYSTAVVHDPSFDGETLKDIKDEKIKEETQKLKDSLVQIYANNTKMSKSQASKMMTTDMMLNAKQQQEYGLIDEILPSKMKPVLTKNMSYAEIMNICEDKTKFQNLNTDNNQNLKKMSDLTKFYNLSDEANEAAILKEAQKDRSELELYQNKVKALEKKSGEKDTEIQNLKEEVEKYRNETITEMVKADIKAGKFLEENEKSLIENAIKIGVEAYKAFSENVAPKSVNILSKVNNSADDKGEKKTAKQKLGEEWQNLITTNKPEALRIRNEEPKKYEEYVEAWNELK